MKSLVYFGTYTGPKSKGIYVAELNAATGKLGAAELAAEITSPSFLALDPNQQFLFAVNEVSNFEGKKGGAVSAYKIDRATGRLTFINQQSSGGGGPCHLTVDRTGKNVLVANYGGGSCAVLPVDHEGRLSAASAFVQHRGSSVNKQRQEAPHAHGIYVDAANRFAFVPDLGLDRVLIYKFDATRGLIQPNDPPFADLPPGSGPRHMTLHPEQKFAYVINEMLCTIGAFRFDPERGHLEQFQTVSTLPDGERVARGYSTAEIEVHPSGKFLYGSNRGHNSIAVFKLDSRTGHATPVQNVSTGGKTPRGFGIDPTGRFLLAANQDSDDVHVFRINLDSGLLSPTGDKIPVGTPVCVVFLPRHGE